MVPNEVQKLPRLDTARQLLNVCDLLGIASKGERKLLVIDRTKVFVPHDSREDILKTLHKSRMGLTRTHWSCHSRYYWSGRREQISKFTEGCYLCQKYFLGRKSESYKRTKPNSKEPNSTQFNLIRSNPCQPNPYQPNAIQQPRTKQFFPARPNSI